MTVRLHAPQPYEELDHTADAAVRVYGKDEAEALGRLILAFAALVGGDCRVKEEVELAVRADPADRALMAVDVLRDLLFRFDYEKLVPTWCAVEQFDERAGASVRVGAGRLDARGRTEGLELKAVTLHDARFEREGTRWMAQVVFDV